LERGAEIADRRAAGAVEELVRRRILQGVGGQLDFVHDRIRHVVLSQLVPAQRRILHRLVGAAIEKVYAGSLDAHAMSLATHYREGEVWDKAVTYLGRAGTLASARLAYRQAVEFLQQAIAALAHLPEPPAPLAEAIDLRLSLRHSLSALGELQTVLTHLREAESLAHTLDDRRRLAWVSAYMGWHFWATGYPAEARTFGERAEAMAEGLGDPSLRVLSTFDLGAALAIAGNGRLAEERFVRVTRCPDSDLSPARFGGWSPAVVSRAWLSWTLAELGDFEAGHRWGADGIRLAEQLDDVYGLIRACSHLGYLHAIKGDVSQAVELLQRALGLCRNHDVMLLAPYVIGVLGYARLLSGQIDAGAELLQQAVAIAQATGAETH